MEILSIIGNISSVIGVIISTLTLIIGVKITNKLRQKVADERVVKMSIPEWIDSVTLWIDLISQGTDSNVENVNELKDSLYSIKEYQPTLDRIEKSLGKSPMLVATANDILKDCQDGFINEIGKLIEIKKRLEYININL